MKRLHKQIIWVSVYALAMAFLESSVVVYLREMFYPNGFEFPLASLSHNIAITEIFREAATIIMLLAVAYIAGGNGPQRFGYFLLSFGIWDVFYYVFLKVLIGWPESLLTWDVLFLIPLTWVGPVIAPVILAIIMCVLGWILIVNNEWSLNRLNKFEWLWLIIGSLVSIFAFTLDHLQFILKKKGLNEMERVELLSVDYVPQHFAWYIFIPSLLMITIGVISYYIRIGKIPLSANKQLFI